MHCMPSWESKYERPGRYEYGRIGRYDMSIEVSADDAMEPEALTAGDLDEGEVAEQLQQVYEYILHDRRPEAVGATERLANQLDMHLERPDEFPGRANR